MSLRPTRALLRADPVGPSRLPKYTHTSKDFVQSKIARIFGKSSIDTGSGQKFTPTGGTGAQQTGLTSSKESTRLHVLGLYKKGLRSINDMKNNFQIHDSWNECRDVLRYNFEKIPADKLKDPKIVDMMVFKGHQEIDEIRAQWKSRTHIQAYFINYRQIMNLKSDRLYAEEQAKQHELISHMHMPEVVDALERQERFQNMKLSQWRAANLIPAEVQTWAHYVHFMKDQETKFNKFAIDQDFFTEEEVTANKEYMKSQGCNVM